MNSQQNFWSLRLFCLWTKIHSFFLNLYSNISFLIFQHVTYFHKVPPLYYLPLIAKKLSLPMGLPAHLILQQSTWDRSHVMQGLLVASIPKRTSLICQTIELKHFGWQLVWCQVLLAMSFRISWNQVRGNTRIGQNSGRRLWYSTIAKLVSNADSLIGWFQHS